MKSGTSFIVRVALLATLAASPIVAWAGDDIDKSKPVEIKLKFRKGDVHYVESISKIVQKIDMGGQKLNHTIHSTSCFRESTVSADEKQGKMEIEFDRMAMNLDLGPMGIRSYDSEGGEPTDGGMLEPIFGTMLHKKVTMEVDASGDVKSFEGMNAIRNEISKKAGMNPMWMQMQGSLNDEAARLEYGEARFQFVPEQTVKVGESWKVKKERQMPGLGGKSLSKTEYKLTDIKMHEFEGSKRRVAVIEYWGTIEAVDSKEDDDAEPAPKIESGSISGTILYDLKRGQPIRSEREGKLNVTQQSPMGAMKIEVTTSEVTKLMTESAREKQREENKAKAKTSGE